jgi:hypothetical protein
MYVVTCIHVYKRMLEMFEWFQLYIYMIIIIIRMNVVDNLNYVKVINKPCMSSRNMCLLPWATLHSDSEQELMLVKTSNYVTFVIIVHTLLFPSRTIYFLWLEVRLLQTNNLI